MTGFSKLWLLTKTEADLARLKAEAQALLQGIYQTNVKALDQVLTQKVRHHIAEVFRELLKNPGERQEILEKLLKETEKALLVRVTLAFEPTDKQLDDLITYFKAEAGERAILSVIYDSRLIGGVIIEIKGKHVDYSVRRILDETTASPEFVEALKA